MISFYEQFFDKGDLVFDAGACHGQLTKRFLEAGAGKVIAIEPNPVLVREMKNTFKGNERVEIVESAVGDIAGFSTIYLSEQAETISTLSNEWKTGRFRNFSFGSGTRVKVVTLDDLITTYGIPKYIKLDIEGYEYRALLGLTSQVYSLSFEFVSEFYINAVMCVERLHALGDYEFSYVKADYEDLQFPMTAGDKMLSNLHDHLGSHPQLWGNIFARRKHV